MKRAGCSTSNKRGGLGIELGTETKTDSRVPTGLSRDSLSYGVGCIGRVRKSSVLLMDFKRLFFFIWKHLRKMIKTRFYLKWKTAHAQSVLPDFPSLCSPGVCCDICKSFVQSAHSWLGQYLTKCTPVLHSLAFNWVSDSLLLTTHKLGKVV